MRINQILLFHFFFSVLIYSQTNITEENSTSIFIKGVNTIIDSKISSVANYGIILTDNRVVSYKVISKIVTDNENILDLILLYVSNAPKSWYGDYFSLDMNNATYEIPVEVDNRILRDAVFMLSLMSNRAENIELFFNFSPRIAKEIYFQMSYTNGRYVDDYSYSLSAISVGVGGKYKFEFGEMLLGINYGGKSLVVSSVKLFSAALYSSEVKYVPYLEILFRSNLLNNSMLFSIGSKYYSSNVSVLDVNTKFNISVGVGIKLGTI
jgi:hypothetical protein